MRQIHFVAFLQAQNCTTLPASWRHPDARTDTYAPEYYQHIARVLEAGKFDIGFFDDRLAMPDMYGGTMRIRSKTASVVSSWTPLFAS
jgi:alkanesulfonate monooxygenase SsuD/methylene tetrahydromethanopterin reductase-like flavin-dependent oxidoreductase (luciferase family)